MPSCPDEPLNGWEGADVDDSCLGDVYAAHEEFCEGREPFTHRNQSEQETAAAVCGHHDDHCWYVKCHEQQRERDGAIWAEGVARLTRDRLAVMRDLDGLYDRDTEEEDDEDELPVSFEEFCRLGA